MMTTKKAVYSMIDLKSTQLCFRVGQVVSLRSVKISLIKLILISYLVSRCVVYLPQCLQNLFTSKRVGFGFPLILIEYFLEPQTAQAKLAFLSAIAPPSYLL